jgi:hypothetical protein
VGSLLWLKDGMDVSGNADYKTEVDGEGVARLQIEEVFPEDSAVFTCRARGPDDDDGGPNPATVETSGRLIVKGKIRILSKKWVFLIILGCFVFDRNGGTCTVSTAVCKRAVHSGRG